MEQSNYKRQYRELDDATKKKLSAAATGKSKTAAHREHISQSMKNYWQGVPHRPSGITLDDIMCAK